MQRVSIHEAKTHLSRLIREIAAGKEIIITSSGKPVATLSGVSGAKKPRRVPPTEFRAWAKKHPIPADFDDPMPDEWFETDEFPQTKRKRKK